MVTSATGILPNYVGGIDDPVNIKIMDVDTFIRDNQALPVTSTLPMEPSTNLFHPDGLYSENIFGPIGSPERMDLFGYIDLGTTIFNPKIFKLIVQLGSLYKDIMKGDAYATFDPVLKDFIRVTGDPLDVDGADTGYSFFLSHFHDLSFKTTASSRRDERIEVIEQYKDFALINKYLVEPAGLRDIANDASGRLIQDDINKIYTSLMLFTRSIPRGSRSTIYDSSRWQIQAKAQEVYEYIENFLDGKRGFIQGSFARRNIAMGTRNVITAATNIASHPGDPQMLKADDVMVGIYQTIKGLQPFTKHAYYTFFANTVFKFDGALKLALSDPKTGKLVYTQIAPSERDKWTSSEGVEKLINNFRNVEIRHKPVFIKDESGKDYAMLLVYDEGEEIALCRSVEDLEAAWPRKIDRKKLRPLTYAEMFYIIAEFTSVGKHCIVTRYPVIEQGSSYVGVPHVVSTTPARVVEVRDLTHPDMPRTLLRQYPVLPASFMDAMMVHPSKLAALGGDENNVFVF